MPVNGTHFVRQDSSILGFTDKFRWVLFFLIIFFLPIQKGLEAVLIGGDVRIYTCDLICVKPGGVRGTTESCNGDVRGS